jgi:hypothetical protein
MTKTPADVEREKDQTAAAAALERADARELHVLFNRAIDRYDQMEDALTKIVAHYVGDKEVPRHPPNNENAIAAMERVAMEALALARLVVEQVTTAPR